MQKLNLGCGVDIKQDYVNLDMFNFEGVDVVCNLGKEKLPFNDNYFDEIIAFHVFEHIQNWEDVLKNCFKILKEGGKLHIKTPYGAKTFQHPYHLRFFYPETLFEFCNMGNNPKGFQLHNDVKFNLISVKVKHQFMAKLWLLKEIINMRISFKFIRFSSKEIEWILEKPKRKVSIDDIYCSDYLGM